jgi:hypothetical protein
MPATYTIERGLSLEQVALLEKNKRLFDNANGIARYRGIKFANNSKSSVQKGLLIVPGLQDKDEICSQNRVYVNMHDPKKKPPEYIDSVYYFTETRILSESLKPPGGKFIVVLVKDIYFFEIDRFEYPSIREYRTDSGKKDVLLFFPVGRRLKLWFTKDYYEEFPF